MSSTSIENANSSLEEQPLLQRGKRRLPSLNVQHWHSHPFRGDPWSVRSTKQKTAQFLSSKAGHYSVLTLVSLDVLSMIADFILNLFKCEQGRKGSDWDLALEILGSVSLVFSCLFVVELIASVWAFGWKYFNSWFHCFDAFIVIAGFITDVALRGIIEEVASLIVVMRLWRVVKIIEELGVGAQEQTEELNVKLEKVESENEDLRSEISRLKGAMRKAGLDQQDTGAMVS
ncbi:voltage-gated hydrogen channel 1 [Fusarium phyllophilum]|uniref:Voltage-gated hydrogen channel 1 n=1 Tax=Fusarium phyllophilum TaxID=47803 RepID=A0A8H5NGY3_9HYPO|nr:voltage-gated hydrogen channel 1 [Fusarium phyllophilum]